MHEVAPDEIVERILVRVEYLAHSTDQRNFCLPAQVIFGIGKAQIDPVTIAFGRPVDAGSLATLCSQRD